MLHVHRADRSDALVAALGRLLADAPGDPFARELVAVPTRGIERWVTQTLSNQLGARAGRGDGIVANVAFPSPREVVEAAVASACGFDPLTDPWVPERAVWPLLDVVDGALHEPWLGVLARHLADSAPAQDCVPPRRLQAVRHLTILYDRYALHRPDMLLAWRDGADVDGSGSALTEPVVWQAELWRRLRSHVGVPSPAERAGQAVESLRASAAAAAELPPRLSVFGLTRLSTAHLRVLAALAAHRDVHLFVLHPSPDLWARVGAELAGASAAPASRREDPTATLPRNRLLASWGRDVRELQIVLARHDPVEHLEPPAVAPATLLSRIQRQVRDDAPPAHDEAPSPLDARDRSIEVHACHGRGRQVEVLRDVILHALAEDPSLEPRDVIVMCPDIEAFAPLITATFGTPVGDGADLRVRLADRALRQTNPVLGAMSRLLALVDSRMTASQVIDFVDQPPVRRRFRLDDDDVVRITEWVAETGIRWGLDAEHRAPFKLDRVAANTWAAGVDRVLVGATMTERSLDLLGGVLPFDDVDSGAIDLAGRWAELLARLRAVADEVGGRRSAAAWALVLGRAADLLIATGPREVWQRTQLERILAGLADDAAGGGGAGALLDLAEVRALLDEHLRGRPSRANFRTGHLTFCTLNPMRSVPHRVVCLLGIDDAAFPRKAPRDGDDLIFDDPHVGDHDVRAEDRQLLLDALLAAEDKLVITYTGHDERTNAELPPAVPVGELLDVVDRAVAPAPGTERPRDAITVHHPLQPFDPRNFEPGVLRAGTPFGFDPATLAGAAALRGPRVRGSAFLGEPLAPLTDATIELDDLVRFVEHPVRAFLRRRLGMSLRDFADELSDTMPIELDGLQQWAIAERMLHALRAGHPEATVIAAERARGALPPGQLGEAPLQRLQQRVRPLIGVAARVFAKGERGSLDARVSLPDGRTVSGTVPGVCGTELQRLSYSRVAPAHRLAMWVRLVVLAASRPAERFTAIVIGRPREGASTHAAVTVSRMSAPDDPLAELVSLVDLYDRGMREPAPLYAKTSAAYAASAAAGATNPATPARRAWESGFRMPREDRDLEHQLVLDGERSLDELLTAPPRADETGAGWDAGQASRVGRWALRLWRAPLAHEELSDP